MDNEKSSMIDFDPDFSEFNPIMSELKEIKETALEVEKEGFFQMVVRKLNMPIIIQTD